MLKDIQRAVISPVNIFQQDHNGGRFCQRFKVIDKIYECAVTDLLGIFQDFCEIWTFAQVKANPMADDVSPHRRFAGGPGRTGYRCPGANTGLHFFLHSFQWIAILDLEAKRENISQQGIGNRLHLLAGATANDDTRFLIRFEPGVKLSQEPAFSQPGFGDERDHLQFSLFGNSSQSGLQVSQFHIPPNHVGSDSFYTTGCHPELALFCSQHKIGLDRFGFAFDRQRRLNLNIKHPVYMTVGIVCDQNAIFRSGTLQTGSQVNRITHGCKLMG